MLCKLKKGDWKKIDKQVKDMLTFDYMSGILTKLFDGDEVQKAERVRVWKDLKKSTWQSELSLI